MRGRSAAIIFSGMTRSQRSWLAAALAGLACVACFSTTAPDVDPPQSTGQAEGTWVRGKVLRSLGGEYRNALDWTVVAAWYGPDRNLDGRPDRLSRVVAKTNTDGVYAIRYQDPRTPIRVEVRAVRCDFDPETNACCLAEPCPTCSVDPWTTAIGRNTTMGQTEQIDVVVRCGVSSRSASPPAALPHR